MGQVVKVMERITGADHDGMFSSGGDTAMGGSSGDAGTANPGLGSTDYYRQLMQGPHGSRITNAVVGVAGKVEENVAKYVTAAAATPTTPLKTPVTPGSATIKQVHRAQGKLLAANPVADPPIPLQ